MPSINEPGFGVFGPQEDQPFGFFAPGGPVPPEQTVTGTPGGPFVGSPTGGPVPGIQYPSGPGIGTFRPPPSPAGTAPRPVTSPGFGIGSAPRGAAFRAATQNAPQNYFPRGLGATFSGAGLYGSSAPSRFTPQSSSQFWNTVQNYYTPALQSQYGGSYQNPLMSSYYASGFPSAYFGDPNFQLPWAQHLAATRWQQQGFRPRYATF